jgi:hypothetical protein
MRDIYGMQITYKLSNGKTNPAKHDRAK